MICLEISEKIPILNMSHKTLVEDTPSLRIQDVRNAIPHGALVASIEVSSQGEAQEVKVIGMLTNLRNGYFYSFVCDRCQRRFKFLYRGFCGEWQCRECAGLTYASRLQ